LIDAPPPMNMIWTITNNNLSQAASVIGGS
jgi:hypothetical protein